MVCDTDSDIKCRNVFLVTTCHVALQETDLYLHLTYRHQKFLQGKVSSSQTESFNFKNYRDYWFPVSLSVQQ